MALEEVGRIYGDVGVGQFKVALTTPVERGEYLSVEDDTHHRVLCQISQLERKSDATAERTLETIAHGSPYNLADALFGKANVVGFRENGIVAVPQLPFKPGTTVFRADESLIADVMGLKENGKTGAYVGMLRGHALKVELDINQLVQRHLSVLAKTGGGKSYLVGVLLEEFLKHNVTCVIIDPHGEYGSLRFRSEKMRNAERFGVESRGFKEKILEFSPDTTLNRDAHPLTFSLKNLDARELLTFMGSTNVRGYVAPLKGLLEAASTANAEYTLKDLIRLAHARAAEEGNPTFESLAEKLEYLEETKLLAPVGTSLHELIVEGKMTIVNLRGIAPDVSELVVTRILGTFFEQRKRGKIPPLFIVIEEAHNYCPQQGQAMSSRILKTVASEGRKFGLGLCIVSQRPARVDKNVLSQCATQLILQVTNPLDVRAISQSIEGLTDGMTEIIQALPVGTCLVSGGGFHTPLFCDVRTRSSRHGGESINVIPT
jgi:DNA helicase HerA-like ATPase